MKGIDDIDIDSIFLDRYGRQEQGTVTRAEWLAHDRADTVATVRYHRDLLGAPA